MDTLEVVLSNDRPYEITPETNSFQTDNSFVVSLTNEGPATHAHLHLDDDLLQTARLAASNHYVQQGQTVAVRIEVSDDSRPVTGRLKIVTGYGAHTEYVTVSIIDPVEHPDRVRVDERLAKPKPRDPGVRFDSDDLPVIAVAALAILVTVGAALIIGGATAVVGLLVVLVGIGIAGLLLLR